MLYFEHNHVFFCLFEKLIPGKVRATCILSLKGAWWRQQNRLHSWNFASIFFFLSIHWLIYVHDAISLKVTPLHETPKLSASVNISLSIPLHCLLILPTSVVPSCPKIWNIPNEQYNSRVLLPQQIVITVYHPEHRRVDIPIWQQMVN